MNGFQLKRWFRAMVMVVTASLLGCGGGESTDGGETPSTDIVEENTDTVVPTEDTTEDTEVVELVPCPGLFDPSNCEEVLLGPKTLI